MDAVARFVDEYRKEEKPPDGMAFPNREWRFVDAGHVVLFFRRPETIAAREGLRKRFRRSEWTIAWSEQRIAEIESIVIGRAIRDTSEAAVEKAMESAAAILDAEPPKWTVVVPLTHVRISDFVLNFPDIEIKSVSPELFTEITNRLHYIIGTTPHTEEEKMHITERADEIFALLRNRAAAFVNVSGDPPLAKARALQMVQPSIDFMQLSASVNHPYGDVTIAVGGDLMTRQPPLLMMSADGSNIRNEDLRVFMPPYEMEPQHFERMKAWGFGPLIHAIGKPDADRTNFERLLINSMHWIGEAERQTSLDNRVTSYVTAIDMFFATKQGQLNRDVTEGTAFVLGSTLDQRRTIAKQMTHYYDIRSGVSHSGDPVDEADASGLKELAINFLAKMSLMTDRFSSKADVQAWLTEQRLSP
jgi:Apea-like HEPN